MQQNMGILLMRLHIYTMEIIRWLRVLICFLCEWVLSAFVSAHSYPPTPQRQSGDPRPETEPFTLGFRTKCYQK